MNVCLAATYHDPDGRLSSQIKHLLPLLIQVFSGIAVRATHHSNQSSLSYLERAGVRVLRAADEEPLGGPKIGRGRRESLGLAMDFGSGTILYCDFDRVLHWAKCYPQELESILHFLPQKDFTVLGRTARAFNSHPRVQRDTEAIANQVFAKVIGHSWDVMAAARGLSRRAAQAILDGCHDDEISVDVTWPLYLRSVGSYSMAYIPTEGMEFETPDQYPEEIAAAGGYEAWLDDLDSNIEIWIQRMDLCRGDLEAMHKFVGDTNA